MLFQGKMAIFSDVWLILSNRFLGGEGKRGRRGRQEGKKRKARGEEEEELAGGGAFGDSWD